MQSSLSVWVDRAPKVAFWLGVFLMWTGFVSGSPASLALGIVSMLLAPVLLLLNFLFPT